MPPLPCAAPPPLRQGLQPWELTLRSVNPDAPLWLLPAVPVPRLFRPPGVPTITLTHFWRAGIHMTVVTPPGCRFWPSSRPSTCSFASCSSPPYPSPHDGPSFNPGLMDTIPNHPTHSDSPDRSRLRVTIWAADPDPLPQSPPVFLLHQQSCLPGIPPSLLSHFFQAGTRYDRGKPTLLLFLTPLALLLSPLLIHHSQHPLASIPVLQTPSQMIPPVPMAGITPDSLQSINYSGRRDFGFRYVPLVYSRILSNKTTCSIYSIEFLVHPLFRTR